MMATEAQEQYRKPSSIRRNNRAGRRTFGLERLGAVAAALIVMSGMLSSAALGQGPAAGEAKPAAPAGAGVAVGAVQTDGSASFRICRRGMFSVSCRIYGHLQLPADIALGDQFVVTFGSNRKLVTFSVRSIRLIGRTCSIFGTTGDGKPDRLVSRHCLVQPREL